MSHNSSPIKLIEIYNNLVRDYRLLQGKIEYAGTWPWIDHYCATFIEMDHPPIRNACLVSLLYELKGRDLPYADPLGLLVEAAMEPMGCLVTVPMEIYTIEREGKLVVTPDILNFRLNAEAALNDRFDTEELFIVNPRENRD